VHVSFPGLIIMLMNFGSIGLTLNEIDLLLMRNKVQYAFVLDVISRGENLHGSDCHVNMYVQRDQLIVM
jgi:hypothetical protein